MKLRISRNFQKDEEVSKCLGEFDFTAPKKEGDPFIMPGSVIKIDSKEKLTVNGSYHKQNKNVAITGMLGEEHVFTFLLQYNDMTVSLGFCLKKDVWIDITLYDPDNY